MACCSLALPLYHLVYTRQMNWAFALTLQVLQYALLVYGITYHKRDARRKALQWGLGLADQQPAKRIRHAPKRIADASGKVLKEILGSGRLYPRPGIVYTKPASSESDVMPNLQVLSAPGLEDVGIPRGPWCMHYKCFFELDDRPRKCVMLIDDVQEAYRSFFSDDYLNAQASVLDAARAGGTPVFWSYWSRMAPDDGGYCAIDEFMGPYGNDEFKGMNATYLKAPSDADLLEELKPRTVEEWKRVISSTNYDCFANKDETGKSIFKTQLDAMGVDTLVLTGCWTDACIIATCIRAVTEDFVVILPEEAVFSATPSTQSALAVMKSMFAKVVPASAVSAYLRASTD